MREWIDDRYLGEGASALKWGWSNGQNGECNSEKDEIMNKEEIRKKRKGVDQRLILELRE